MIQFIPILHVLYLLEPFARGGGGGSSGGGGSGGGGGAGGILMVGYIPAHFVTSWLRKRASTKAALIGGILTSVAVTVAVGFLSLGLAIVVAIGAGIGVKSGMNNWLGRLKKRVTRSKIIINTAAERDGVWKEASLQKRIIEVFYAFQQDWSTFNLTRMQTYLSPRYFDHMRLMLTVLQQMGRRDAMGRVSLQESTIIEANDQPNDDNDSFTAYISASAQDILVDTVQNKVLFQDNSSFQESWLFDRQGDEWVLDGIRQATENAGNSQISMQDFAARNHMYYSLDMGWLLLPQRGQLFGGAQFGRSDINNHIIGEWDGLIVQLYTYVPFKASQRSDDYLIGQIILPKQYGGIIIEKHQKFSWSGEINLSNFGWLNRAPRGYQKISMEWPDFNKHYTVYATDMDKFTSFELLNPAFMASLYDEDLPVSIEVVDNVVYLYAKTMLATNKYDAMMQILQRAHKELKM